MRVIPVIDLMGGVVVRGVGGRRAEYRPVESRLTTSCEPGDVAAALVAAAGAAELYVADLDAIAGAEPAWEAYRAIRAAGVPLWIDAGVQDADGAAYLARAGVEVVVVGLETLRSMEELGAIVRGIGPERVVFSLDLKSGRPLHGAGDAVAIAAAAVGQGVRRVIVLDLARVGERGGVGTEAVCAELVRVFPKIEFAAGGGMRDKDDLRRLEAIGVRAALVATALHEGWIKAEEHAR
jgi:phosphoribosylformimino-5-aminoimidazole carboxamide ribotide isomerase